MIPEAEVPVGQFVETVAWDASGIGGALKAETIDELIEVARKAIVAHIQETWLGEGSGS